MADERFQRIVRSPLEYTFGHDPNGQYAQQICQEMEGKSNILIDATYMPTSEDSRHKGRRSEEIRDTAEAAASDQGNVFSEGTHDSEYETELGMVHDGCKFDSVQEGNAPSQDVAERNRRDISESIESLNRKDAHFTIYGDRTKNYKEWNGFAYYTRACIDRAEFEANYYAKKNPFAATGIKDLCLCLDNQSGASKPLTAADGNVFGSIFAVVWDPKYVAKLYPKNSMSLGIDTDVALGDVVTYVNKETGRTEWLKQDLYSFKKASGVNVHDRFGLIRIANINMDSAVGGVKHDAKEEYERLCLNMAFVEELLAAKGIDGRVKFYAPVPLIRKMRSARALGKVSQSNIVYSIPGVEQAGQIHGIMAERFYLNDNYLITPEFEMVQTEAFVGKLGA